MNSSLNGCAHVLFTADSNLQEKLLGVLKRIPDADLGCWPCNCPSNHKVNGVCAYSSNGYSCQTARTVYKIKCKNNGCNCFYIEKSQQYVKKRVQEHIGEVARIYANTILPTHQHQQSTRRTSSQPQTLTTSSIELSLDTQANSVHEFQPLCVIINDDATNRPKEEALT